MNRQTLITGGGHFLLLQLIWPAAVLGAARGWAWLALPVLLAMPLWSLVRGLPVARDLRMLIVGLLVGIFFETLLLGTGVIDYRLMPGPGWVPAWILLLWAGFAINCNHCLAWLQGRWWLAALLGATGGPLSVLAGVSLGAATAPAGTVPLVLVYGLCWALLMPLLAWLARYYRSLEQEGALQ